MMSLLRPGYELDKLLIIGMFLITRANFQNLFPLRISLTYLKELDCLNFHCSRFFLFSVSAYGSLREKQFYEICFPLVVHLSLLSLLLCSI